MVLTCRKRPKARFYELTGLSFDTLGYTVDLCKTSEFSRGESLKSLLLIRKASATCCFSQDGYLILSTRVSDLGLIARRPRSRQRDEEPGMPCCQWRMTLILAARWPQSHYFRLALFVALAFELTVPARPLSASRTVLILFACSEHYRRGAYRNGDFAHIGPRSYCFDGGYPQDCWRFCKFRNARAV
jgi:hypothetical protein